MGKIIYYYLYCRSILENPTKDLEANRISSETISTLEPSSKVLETNNPGVEWL